MLSPKSSTRETKIDLIWRNTGTSLASWSLPGKMEGYSWRLLKSDSFQNSPCQRRANEVPFLLSWNLKICLRLLGISIHQKLFRKKKKKRKSLLTTTHKRAALLPHRLFCSASDQTGRSNLPVMNNQQVMNSSCNEKKKKKGTLVNSIKIA